MPERILLADDHALVREGLGSLLKDEGFDVVGSASDGLEAVRLADALKPDVAVLDLGMPQMNGLDAARTILRSAPGTKIVILTMHTEAPYVIEALRAGAHGYVLKTQATVHLVQAIREVARGSTYLSPGISRTVVDAVLAGGDAPRDPLTTREREVLQLIADGKSAKEIAAALDISVRTAEAHRAHIMEKLDIHETAGLVRYAIRQGFVVP
jgi:two-component system, NarL family, response regulator NreC